jgi:hypothetical protein
VDERRGLVGLREPRRRPRSLAASERLLERLEPSRLVGVRARLGVEGDPFELRRHRLDPELDVSLPREPGVVQARLEHPLVPGPHDVRLAAVRHEGEPRSAKREVALVCLHRRLDHALGELEELLVEPTVEDEGALDEVDDLVQDAGRVAPLAERVKALDDQSTPLLGVDDDACRAQRLLVVRGVLDLDGP